MAADVGRYFRDDHAAVLQTLVVHPRELAPAGVPLFELPELDPQDGRLDLVQARVVSDDRVVIAGRLSVLAERSELLGEAIVARGDAPRFTVRAEILGAVEREAVHAAASACPLAVVEESAVRLRGVFDDRDVPVLSELLERLEIHGPSVKVDRDDRLCPRRDRGRDRGRIDEHRFLVDVDEDRPGVRVQDRFDGREERMRHGDDLVTAGHAAGSDRELQCVRAAAHADRMLGPDVRREFLIECLDVRPDGELHALEHVVDRPADFVADRRVLSFQVDEGDFLRGDCGHDVVAPSFFCPWGRSGRSLSHAYACG